MLQHAHVACICFEPNAFTHARLLALLKVTNDYTGAAALAADLSMHARLGLSASIAWALSFSWSPSPPPPPHTHVAHFVTARNIVSHVKRSNNNNVSHIKALTAAIRSFFRYSNMPYGSPAAVNSGAGNADASKQHP